MAKFSQTSRKKKMKFTQWQSQKYGDDQAGSHPSVLAPGLVWLERRGMFRFALHLALKTMLLRAVPRASIPKVHHECDIWETELRDDRTHGCQPGSLFVSTWCNTGSILENKNLTGWVTKRERVPSSPSKDECGCELKTYKVSVIVTKKSHSFS